MGGTSGERVNKIANDFNASQSDYKVIPSYKGNYTETMTAAIAAFRAKKQPHIVQVFEVGTATMMAAKGAVYPVEQVMKDAGETFNKSIGTDKLTSEGGLGCHIEWCFGMDTGLETPH
jgi:sn-glycerol 3-phosphate transport system substrate-binding protein